MSQKTCKNCGAEHKSFYKYCPECGQKVNEDLTLGVLFNNTISNYFSVDARFFKSFIPLMFKPGFLAKQFIGGKRLTYLHPAQFYLFISVVFFFIFSFSARKQQQEFDAAMKQDFEVQKIKDSVVSNKDKLDSLDVEQMLKPLRGNKAINMDEAEIKQLDSVLKSSPEQTPTLTSFAFDKKKVDSLIDKKASNEEIYKAMGLTDDASAFQRRLYTQILKLYKNRGGGILGAFYDTIPIAMFFLLPIFALILKLFFYKRGRYAHHLVFSFYFFSFLFMVFSFIFLMNYIHDFPDWIDFLIVLSTFIYLFLAIWKYYGKGVIESFIKTSVITFIYLLVIIPAASIIVGFIAFMFY